MIHFSENIKQNLFFIQNFENNYGEKYPIYKKKLMVLNMKINFLPSKHVRQKNKCMFFMFS